MTHPQAFQEVKFQNDTVRPDFFAQNDLLCMVEEEIRCALTLFLKTADAILAGSGTRLLDAPPNFYSLKSNFFSALFLFSYHQAKISRDRRILYAAVNQCLRGMVTGCDNLLDDEYKQTLATDLPKTATRFRSVLDIMVSDRVFFDLMLMAMEANYLTSEHVQKAGALSLQALLRSGAQEAGEENGVQVILLPEDVLFSVHHYKTGLLFQAPWAIPAVFEKPAPIHMERMKEALYKIGMGCQILDDIVDLQNDIRNHRHNYLFSLICHASNAEAQHIAKDLWSGGRPVEGAQDLSALAPESRAAALQTALKFLTAGLEQLFADTHAHLVEPAVVFLLERIGVRI